MVDRIRDLCKKKGITIAELERQCGIGNGIIARWKKSKPSFERVVKVANYLGVTPEYLLTGEKEEPAGQETDGRAERFMELFSSLTEEKQDLVINLLEPHS